MSTRIRPSKRTRKLQPTSTLSATLVGARISLSEKGIRERQAASRSITLCEPTVPLGWEGQALKTFSRELTGEIAELISLDKDGNEVISKHALAVSKTTDITKDFQRIVHLRGITQRTHNLMIGATTEPVVLYDGKQLDRRLGKVHAQSPSQGSEDFDPLYHSKVLLRTRKSRKLAQRPAPGATITLPSQHELSQAGIEYDLRVTGEESETIKCDVLTTRHNQEIAPRIAVSRVLAGLDSHTAALYSSSERARDAHNTWSPLAPSVRAGTHADRPEDAGQGDVPIREWWDYRQTGYPRALALLLHATS